MGKKLLKTHKVSFQDEGIEFLWYPVVTQYNHERKVAEVLKNRFENMGAGDKLKEIFVPIEEWEEESLGRIKKDGTRTVRKVKKSRNLLESGYIFVKMIMTNDTWNIVRQTTGVSGWLSRQGRPQPVSEEEILSLKDQMGEGKEARAEIAKDFVGKIGNAIRITDGPFKGYEGKILDIQQLNIQVEIEPNGIKMEVSPLILEVI